MDGMNAWMMPSKTLETMSAPMSSAQLTPTSSSVSEMSRAYCKDCLHWQPDQDDPLIGMCTLEGGWRFQCEKCDRFSQGTPRKLARYFQYHPENYGFPDIELNEFDDDDWK